MPSVPILPSVAPQDIAIPKFRVDTPLAAFGGASAQATEAFGSQLAHAGDELFKRAEALQQLKNETEARDADAQFQIEAGKMHAQYNSLEGLQAGPDALEKHTKDLEELRQKVRGGLSNDAARKLYDGPSTSTMGRTIFSAAGHSAQQMKVANDRSLDAQMTATMNQGAQFSKDPRALAQGEAQIRAYSRQRAENTGGTKETVDTFEFGKVSDYWTSAILSTAETDPWAATKMLEANKSKLDAKDLPRVEAQIQTKQNMIGARNIADEVNADLRKDPTGAGKSLQARLEDADKIAESRAPNNPVLKDVARNQVIAQYRQATGAKKEFDQGNRDAVSDALVSPPGGKTIHTVDELRAVPGLDAKINSLPPKEQEALQGRINRYNAAADKEANEQNYKYLLGLSRSEPDKFLSMDLTSEKLNQSQMNKLYTEQKNIRRHPEDDGRVLHAMSVMRADLQAAGVNAKDDVKRYYTYQGAMQDALAQYRANNGGKQPGDKDIQEMGRKLLTEVYTGGETFGGWLGRNKTRPFEVEVPGEIYTKAKEEADKRGIAIEDWQIERDYRSMQFQKLYGGSAKSEPKVPTQ